MRLGDHGRAESYAEWSPPQAETLLRSQSADESDAVLTSCGEVGLHVHRQDKLLKSVLYHTVLRSFDFSQTENMISPEDRGQVSLHIIEKGPLCAIIHVTLPS